ncbi:MAG: hypothetical protein ACLQU0_00810 [Syntrophobacteraceae bacterium]
MRYLQNMMDLAQGNVWGTARVKLYKGSCQAIGRRSERSLYSPASPHLKKTTFTGRMRRADLSGCSD